MANILAQEQTVQQEAPQSISYAGGGIDWMLWRLDGGDVPLPGWWSPTRDLFLRRSVRSDTIVSAISYNRVVGIKNMTWRLHVEKPELEPLVEVYQKMFNEANFGDGFRTFLELYSQDSYNQDNGAFIELIGQGDIRNYHDNHGNSFLAKGYLPKYAITGFSHLDAAQIHRTNSREFPFVYTDPWTGQLTVLHWTRMIGRSQFRQPITRGRGIGLSAISRAFQALNIINVSNEFIEEKMSGASPEIAISKGVALGAIKAAIEDSALDLDAKGMARYKGTVFVEGDQIQNGDPFIQLVGLRQAPDGWDREKELTLAMYIVAMAYATDVRDLGWSFGTTGATKADAEVQDLKTSGKGRADVITDLEEIFNLRVLPDGIVFEFDRKDDLEDKRKAEIAAIRASTRQIQVITGELGISEARIEAAKQGDIDPSFLASDITVEGDKAGPRANQDRGRQIFRSNLFSAMNRLRKSGDISDFFIEASDLLKTQGQLAYLRGIKDGGAPGVFTIGALESNERQELQSLINEQVGFLSNLTRDIDNLNFASMKQRTELWMNKGLDGIYNSGIVAGNANQNLVWKIGTTEKHCLDCLNFDGRVYRSSIWKRNDIQPRSTDLECSGYNCDCTLKATEEAVTPGRPPKLIGKKDHDG